MSIDKKTYTKGEITTIVKALERDLQQMKDKTPLGKMSNSKRIEYNVLMQEKNDWKAELDRFKPNQSKIAIKVSSRGSKFTSVRRMGTQTTAEIVKSKPVKYLDSSQLYHIGEVREGLVLGRLNLSNINDVVKKIAPEDLLAVNGIGPRTVERIYDFPRGTFGRYKKKKP